ncbi:MAG TPA: enoyl-CoA hydratase-related protein, partial [Spirochaetia bacterium]|nr:enoyl-CoA hydratase-related protein [Spirochaetia bacterium]
EVRFGLIPANVLPYLLRWRMSPQKARYLVLTARRLSAAEAAGMGLVDEVCSSETLEKEVRALVKGLLRSSPSAIEAGKRATAEWADLSRNDAIERAVALLESLVNDPVTQADIAGFESGDLPPWFAAYKPAIPLAGTPQVPTGLAEEAESAPTRKQTDGEEK